MLRMLTGALLLCSAAAVQAQSAVDGSPLPQEPDSAAVVAAVRAYHRALENADTAAVHGLLAEEAMVLESGGVEDRDHYFEHHLPADMAFATAVHREREVIRVTVRGDVAWVVSRSRTTGTFRGREIDSQGAELMVLTRTRAGWRIAAIHWSAR